MALSFDQLRKKYAEVLSRPVSRGLSTLGNNVKTSTSNFVRNPGQSAKTIGKELWRIPQDAAYGVGSMPAFHTRTVPYARKEAERLSNRSLDLQKEVQRAQELGNYKLARQLMDRSNSAKKQAQWTERVVTNMPTIKDWIKGNQKEPSLRMDAFTKGVTSGARTALTGKGLQNPAMVAKALPLSVGLSGGITALSGGDLAQGIGSGITAAPRAVGLNSLTQPYFDKLMPKTLSGLQATGTKFAVGAGTSLAEDQAYTLATEGRLPTAGENVFSIVLGGVTGTAYKQPDGRVKVEFPDKSTLTWNEKLQRYQDSGGRMAKKAVEWVGEQREELSKEIEIPVTNKLTGETYYIKTTRGQQGFVKPDELIPGVKPKSGFLRINEPEIGKQWKSDEMVARERFDLPKLKKLSGGGSDRDVYDLGDGLVLKVAKTARGLAQNASEGELYAPVPKSLETGKNYVVVQKADPPNAKTKKIVKELKEVMDYNEYQPGNAAVQKLSAKYYELGDDDTAGMLSDLANYDLMHNDLISIRNWGSIDGEPVLLDAGTLNSRVLDDYKGVKNLNDPDFRDSYYQSKTAKKKFGDTDPNTMYGLAGGAYGFERDEEGNIVFNPEKAVYGMTLGLGVTKGAKYINKTKPQSTVGGVDDTLNLVRQAIDSGDEGAAKAIYQTIEGQKPTFESLVDEVTGVQNAMIKEAKNLDKKDYGEYQDLVKKFRTLLKRSGESTNETGMLNREHIPASKFGVGSDTVATDLGMSETEFMAQITKDLDMAGKGIATPQQLARLDQNVQKIKNIVTNLSLDKDFYKINKDELGRNLGVTALPGGQKSPKTLRKVTQRAELVAKKEFDDWQRAVVSQSGGGRTTRQAIDVIARNIEQNTGGAGDLSNAKDISNLSKGFNTVYRNFQRVFGDKYPQVKSRVLDPFDKSKGKHVDDLEKEAGSLYKNIVQGLGIKKGSKESAAVQLFGEGKKSYDDLVKEFGQQKADNIVQADKWFRSQYDRLLSEVNLVRKRIYPNNPDKIIPKRKDYYRHFREMREGFGALLNIFDSPGNIAPGLESISENTKPRSKWLSFAQKRIGERTDVDAVGGFLDYIRSSSYAKNIDPHIQVFRGLRDDLVKATSDVKDPNYGRVNNFINFLDKYANDLSGKTNQADRVFQEIVPGGRRAFAAINWLNNRVKANVILGNVSSSLAQILNLPQGVASAGRYNAPGLGRTMIELFSEKKALNQSDFIKERYSGDVFNQFDSGMLNNTKKFAKWMTGALDEVATKYIWNAHYEKALREGLGNPVKYADDVTRSLVGGRGIGEVPLMQKARTFQMIAPFQLEVGNFWYVMKDIVDKKQFGKLATLFVMTHVMNKGLEAIRGSGGAFDPIQAMIDMYDISQDDGENKGLRMAGRGAGEVLSNIPLGQSVAAAYPEYGFKVGDTQLPTREALFGDADPTRFGSGLLAMKGIQDPLFKVLPPFGGNQLKKTITGAQAYNQGYSETKSGKVRFPIDKNPVNLAKSVAFGEYSTNNARDYFKGDSSPLGDNQSQTFKKLLISSPEKALDYYNSIIGRRGEGKVKDVAMATIQVYANEGNTLPSETDMLGALYNKAKGVVDGYAEDKLLLENDPTLDYDERIDRLDELEAKYQGWDAVVKRIEKERPEQLLTLQINEHVSGGGKTTEERAKWVYDTLTKMPQGQKKVDFAKRLLDEKVITKSVYEELEKTYDLKLPAYKEGSTIKVRKSGSKKPKKLPKDLFKAVKLVKPKSSGSSIKVRKLSRKKPTRVSLKPKKVVAISPI